MKKNKILMSLVGLGATAAALAPLAALTACGPLAETINAITYKYKLDGDKYVVDGVNPFNYTVTSTIGADTTISITGMAIAAETTEPVSIWKDTSYNCLEIPSQMVNEQDGKLYNVVSVSGFGSLSGDDYKHIKHLDLSKATNLTNVAGSAFSGNTHLTSVTFPASLTNIGTSAFFGCTGITSLVFPDIIQSNTMTIGGQAFAGIGTTNIVFPNTENGYLCIYKNTFRTEAATEQETSKITKLSFKEFKVSYNSSGSGNEKYTTVRFEADSFLNLNSVTEIDFSNLKFAVEGETIYNVDGTDSGKTTEKFASVADLEKTFGTGSGKTIFTGSSKAFSYVGNPDVNVTHKIYVPSYEHSGLDLAEKEDGYKDFWERLVANKDKTAFGTVFGRGDSTAENYYNWEIIYV